MNADAMISYVRTQAKPALLMATPHQPTYAPDPYTMGEYNSLKAMIIKGTGPAVGMGQDDRTDAVRAMSMLVTRDPSRLGKIISGGRGEDVATLIAYARSRR